MKSPAVGYYISTDNETVEEQIRRRFALKKRKLSNRVVVYYDTFDWRLFRKARLLRSEDGWFSLLTTKFELLYRGFSDDAPEFEWGLPAGPLRNELTKIVEMRRIFPVLKLRLNGSLLDVLDDVEKTVVRLSLLEGVAQKSGSDSAVPIPGYLVVSSVKGYDHDFREINDLIRSCPAVESDKSEFELGLDALGIIPNTYSSKLGLQLRPSQQAGEALKLILDELFSTLLLNEEGTREDWDSEFLHDFRVAVRRTRSALAQLKTILPEGPRKHFSREFSWLGSETGPTRDLDVHLLRMRDYRSSLPKDARGDIEPLEDFLHRHQEIEHRKLGNVLDSERYRNLIDEWREFLANADLDSEPSSRLPILEVAGQRIWKTYKRILKRGNQIGPKTEPEALHRLRIDCKKLRYLLEFFKSLYDAQEIKKLIKTLRRLQNNLGDFNDFQVQQDKLRGFAESMISEGVAQAGTMLAMGRLIERLKELQFKARNDFSIRFEEFSDRRNQDRFKKSFQVYKGRSLPK